jgi:hypothetical protein
MRIGLVFVLNAVQIYVVNFSWLLIFDLDLKIFVNFFKIFIRIKVVYVLKFLFVQSIGTRTFLVGLSTLLFSLEVI